MHSPARAGDTAFRVLVALSLSHLLNDVVQALLPSLYPVLQANYRLNFTQIGLLTLVFQGTASLLQPLVGMASDRRPMPASLAVGMGISLAGVVVLAVARDFAALLAAAALVGLGSAIFHPEAARVARFASGGRHGLAQSFFQVGGNAGTALGPLLVVVVVGTRSQLHVLWFSLLALAGIVVLHWVGGWYRAHLATRPAPAVSAGAGLSRGQVVRSVAVLLVLIFSKFFYLAGMTSFYTFYLMERFGLGIEAAQIQLFVFLFAVAAGTILGGPLGDRFGRRRIIWASILGAAPFTLLLPHAGLAGCAVLAVGAGLVLSSAFSAILVYAQELVPGRIGVVSGLFLGFAFGMGGLGSAALGALADRIGIDAVFRLCAYLPLLGLLTMFLPELRRPAAGR